MTPSKLAPITLALLLAPALVAAQGVTGMWDITASFTLPFTEETVAPPADCFYSGKGIGLTQSGSAVSGTVDLNLDSGPTPDCPGAIISGELDADLMGTSFSGTLDGGKVLGTATVEGTISTAAKSAAAASVASTMMGTASVGNGPFSGSSGTFTGQQLPVAPTLGPAAIGIMALILFGGSMLLLTRRERVSL